MPGSSTGGLTADELTLHWIATGVIAVYQRLAQGESIYPYPPQLQRGLDRLTIAALRQGQPAPQGIPELLGWCRDKPLLEWPLRLPEDALGADDTLLIGEQPSSICDAWACASPDVEAELTERRIMTLVLDRCAESGDTAAYRAFRRLVIEFPILTALEFQQHCISQELLRLHEALRLAYQVVPAGWSIDGEFQCCGRCGNLLIPLVGAGVACESAECQRQPILIGRRIPLREAPLWLIRGLRRFVAAPGQAELRLARRLEDLGLAVELWPMLDRYDLRLTFPRGTIWAIDVKDWANPFLLARNVKPISREPRWDRAFFVFPDQRRRQRPDYVRAFRQACAMLDATTSAVMERELIRRAKEQLAKERA